MKKYIFILVLALPIFAFAQESIEPQFLPPGVDVSGIVDETPDLWFVELSSNPAADGVKLETLKKEKEDFRTAAKEAGLKYSERMAFDTLWNGFSVRVNPGSLETLTRIPGVKAIYPVVKMKVPETFIADPDLFTALSMTGADAAQSELGFTGEGVKVAVMDTGIDYDHPDLGGCFGPGCRVAYGYDFVGDDYDAETNPIPVPDDDPDDCQGHGTHVAGIIGANGGITGVAPDVTFGAYRVFGCDGSTDADIMMAAMEKALADDMDVLNMSIGAPFQWPQYPTAQASDRLVKRGMVVVASIGNSGTLGTYAAGAPGVGREVIGVASFDNTNSYQSYFEVDGSHIPYLGMEFADLAPTDGTEEIVYIGTACDGEELEADPSGKVALIQRGTCTFYEKAVNALANGATAAVIHNSVPGNFSGTLGEYVSIAVVSISQEDGLFIREQETPVYMTWTDQQESFPNPTGGLISSFSSYGLAPDLSLKPDIGAPGGSIYSTYPLESGEYASMGGTSMASPHVAGSAALLLQAKPRTRSQSVRDILQNSADPAMWNLGPDYGLYDSVHRQGAGMLDIDDAIMADTIVKPGKISLGEGEAGPSVHVLTIENNGRVPVTYDLSEDGWAITTTGTWAEDIGYWLDDHSVSFDPASVTVPPGGRAEVDVTFWPPAEPDLGTYGGYILLTPQEGGQEYRVPFAGFIGDYQALPVLDANPYGLPWLMGGPVFTMEDDDMPEFWVNIGHSVPKLRMEIRDANTNKSWHLAYELNFLERNSNYNSIYALPWDGTTVDGRKTKEVPDGDYVVVISVLKALGDEKNPDHWETWTSPTITIDRPFNMGKRKRTPR